MKKFLLFLLSTVFSVSLFAQTVNLGTAATYGVLAGTTVTNTGNTVINGDLGLAPGTSVTGFFGTPTNEGPGVVTGTININNAAAIQAKADLQAAYDSILAMTPTDTIPSELGGQTLTPGVYTSADGTFTLTDTLTLDANGDPNAVFIFRTASTLTTITGSQVVLINGAEASNVFFQVGSSATLGTNSVFVGTILANTSITATTGAQVNGRLLAINGAVTLDTNNITVPSSGDESDQVLPVSLKSFTATRNGNKIDLRWETASETNNKGFNVQRNTGGGWQTVAFVASKANGGNSNAVLSYTINDVNTSRGVTQYRVQQVDIDGKSSYSDIRAVRGEGLENRLLVYPNPSNTGNLNVVFEDQNAVRDVVVRDMSGRLVKQYKEVTNNILVIDNLMNGVYSIQVIDRTTSKSVFEKVVVRRN